MSIESIQFTLREDVYKRQVLLLAKLPDKLCQIVGDESVVIGEMFGAELRYLPAGDVAEMCIRDRGITAWTSRQSCS